MCGASAMACKHPAAKLKIKVDDVSTRGGCPTCGYGEGASATILVKCECGFEFKKNFDSEDEHMEWHAIVVATAVGEES